MEREEEITKLSNEREEFLDLLHDCYIKHCRYDDGYDHMCDGTYRCIQKILIENGMVGEAECVRD